MSCYHGATRFKVGEVCIVTHSILETHPPGCEVTILEIVQIYVDGAGVVPVYLVDRMPNGSRVFADDGCLKPKKPPDEPLGEWDLCPWRPGRETVSTDPTPNTARKSLC
jgi:hypothetical protein